MTTREPCDYDVGLTSPRRQNPRAIVRALILLFSTAFMATTLSTSAGQELCRNALAARATIVDKGVIAEAVDALYAKAGKGCVWTTESADALAAAIAAAPEHGLDPELFGASIIARHRSASDEAARAQEDLRLTAGALKYAQVMTAGVGGIAATDEETDRRALQKKLIDEMSTALEEGRVAAWLATLPPQTTGYQRLKYALGVYREFDAAGGWEALPARLAKKSGKRIARDELLARRLRIEGDLTDDEPADDSNPTVDALKHFQTRHGLAASGKLDKGTLDALNVSARDRVQQIAANLERWRAFSRAPAATRVEVNAAAATATLFRDNKPVLHMNAVVGRPKHDTPILHSTIMTIVINPPWIVPKSIIDKEIRPTIARDGDYLQRNHMYWSDDGQLIQEPGPQNSLGRIKFEFPNNYGVYLHDTPAHALFADVDRAQSHGCVRLEHPLDLAEELLKDNADWPREAIEQAIRDGDTVRVPLEQEMPVVLAYWTVFVDDDGTIEFRPDVYDRDAPLAAALLPQASLVTEGGGA